MYKIVFYQGVVWLQVMLVISEFAKGVATGRYSDRKFVGERFWGEKAGRVDQKLWPEHCVQGTPGAEVDAALMNTLSDANKATVKYRI